MMLKRRSGKKYNKFQKCTKQPYKTEINSGKTDKKEKICKMYCINIHTEL